MKEIKRKKGSSIIQKLGIIGVIVIIIGIFSYLILNETIPSILEKQEISDFING